MSELQELFIAIECEELPARFVDIAATQLKTRLQKILKQLETGAVQTFATPRRVAVAIQVSKETPLQEQTITGPPVKAAYRDGEPTKAAIGFAKSRGKAVADLITVESKRGPVIGLQIQSGGEKTVEIVAKNLSEIVLGMDFPQQMSWGDGSIKWARPLHNIIAIYNGELIPATIGNLQTSNKSSGHRLFSDVFEVNSAESWKENLNQNCVLADKEERRSKIEAQLNACAQKLGSSVLAWDLLDEVVDLVEWPVTIVSNFDEDLLELPPRLLIEAMKIHQRVFPLERDGKLSNSFLVVTNHPYATDEETAANIAEGNRRVLTARFYDAKFFYAEDRRKKLEDNWSKLEGMRWIRNGGTMADKSNRLVDCVKEFVDVFGADLQKSSRAAKLCKCDLGTKMVYEFPELQGHVGHLLAKLEGEDSTTSLAIEEHYLPTFSGDNLPSTKEGLVLAFADRWDTLNGCFSLGLQPKGSGDPLGLRRAANGLVQIIIEAGIAKTIADLCSELDCGDALKDFILARLRAQLQDEFATDIVNAVMSTGDTSPLALHSRCQAIQGISKSENFSKIKTTFKRVMGLGKKHDTNVFSTDHFAEQAEHDLYDAFEKVRSQIEENQQKQDYEATLQLLHALAPNVDQYFESVMVMAEDETVRFNRLGFLRTIADSFTDIADFTQLQTEN